MLRRAFSMIWIVSLVLFLAAMLLWARSYRTLSSMSDADSIYIKHSEPIWWIISYPGRATLCRQVGRDWDKDLNGFDVLGIKFGGGWGPESPKKR